MRSKFGLIILICLIIGLVVFVFMPRMKKYSESQLLMGTIVEVAVCYDSRTEDKVQDTVDHVWSKLHEISNSMSLQVADSDVVKLNLASPKSVKCSPETYSLLKKAKYFSEITKGAFDVTVAPSIALWKKGSIENVLPNSKEIDNISRFVGSEHIQILPSNYARLLERNASIDLGGIAKGFAVDEASNIFREQGFKNFLIDAGGDIYVGGKNCKNKKWRIGIRDPKDKSRVTHAVELTDAAVTTSGDYERYFEIQGKRYSHIIDPRTGYPQKGVVSATVIAPNAVMADALSTSLCVLNVNQGTALIDALGSEVASFTLLKKGEELEEYVSRNYEKMRVKLESFSKTDY